jgi:hypothetical protein
MIKCYLLTREDEDEDEECFRSMIYWTCKLKI